MAPMLPEYAVIIAQYSISTSIGPHLMAEIGDVRRFARKQALVAFAGVDPSPNDSGDKYSRSNKTTKRGSPYLSKTLFCIISGLLQIFPADDPNYKFLDKKAQRRQIVLCLYDCRSQ